LTPNRAQTIPLERGVYQLEVLPKESPIFSMPVTVDERGADGDSLTVIINALERLGNVDVVSLTVNGYRGKDISNKLRDGLLINGHEWKLNDFYDLKVELPRGLYEIRFNLPDELFESVMFDTRSVFHPSTFRFDFSQFPHEESGVSFRYMDELPESDE